MKILNKFTVELSPSTIQMAYMDAKPETVDINWYAFADGSIAVDIPAIKSLKSANQWKDTFETVRISAFIESMNDLMVVAQIKDVFERKFKTKTYILNILSTPYTRYDRPMLDDGTDGFGSLVFSRFVNALKFDSVTLIDPHSDVIVEQIERCVPIHMLQVWKKYFDLSENGDVCIIAPDKGACKKMLNKHGLAFDKVRNVKTRRIESMELSSLFHKGVGKKQYVVVDDICEGGRTFLQVADVFERNIDKIDPENKRERLTLAITHGIFTYNSVNLLLQKYTDIHVHIMKKSTYDALNEAEAERIHVDFLVDTE